MLRKLLLTGGVMLALLIPAAAAQEIPRATDDIYKCADIQNDEQRLACFDGAVAALRSAEEAGTVRTVAVAEIERVEREAFGLTLPNLRQMLTGDRQEGARDRVVREEISEVTLAIRSVSAHPVSKRLTVVLADGQSWEQIDSRRLPASTLRRPQEARIRRAALGSYLMTIDDSLAFRVKRVS